jgi:hypothetical protein
LPPSRRFGFSLSTMNDTSLTAPVDASTLAARAPAAQTPASLFAWEVMLPADDASAPDFWLVAHRSAEALTRH